MIELEEFKYLTKYAIDFFKRGSETNKKYIYYEDVAWDYARGILNNTLNENKKQDLYLKLITKLNKQYQICFPNIIYNSIGNGNVPDEKSEAILLFLMDWNRQRFINQVNREYPNKLTRKLKNYINGTLQAIYTILQSINDIRDKFSKEAFEEVEGQMNLGKHEYVSAAKILMLINPDRFIAWDNKIAKNFFRLPSNNPTNYEKFNDLINNFLDRFSKDKTDYKDIQNYAEKYMEEKDYINIDSHKIRKLLDMIFWIACNTNSNSSEFDSYVEKLKESIIQRKL